MLGLIVILVIAVAQGQFTQTEQLAAIFSGWITSIIAFYFYGQSNAQAQTQIASSTKAAAVSEQRASKAENKLNNVKSMVAAHAVISRIAPPSGATASDEIIKNIKDVLEKE